MSRTAQRLVSVPLLGLAGCVGSGVSNRAMPKSGGPASFENVVAELETQLPALMAEYHVPGLSIATVHDGKISWSRAFGYKDASAKILADNETVFQAGSMSKPVFAYAALKLCEKGILDLDTPLTNYTTERFVTGDSRLELITGRHLLSHTSGFQNWRSAEEPLQIHFTPGSQYLYSGEGYFYLQSVITDLLGRTDTSDCAEFEAGLKVCATDIDQFLIANVLKPFSMTSSGYAETTKIRRPSRERT